MNAQSVDSALRSAGALRSCVAWLQLYPLLGGAVSLVGWATGVVWLTDWSGTGISIQPNAALASACTGAALLALGRGLLRLARALGVLVAAIGGATLFEYGTGLDLGLDSLLMFGRDFGQVGVLARGRMGPPGAVAWTMLGLGVVLAARPAPSRARGLATALGLCSGAIATLSLIGYLYRATELYTLPHATVIALQTATFVLVASVGLVCSAPERWPARLFAERSVAGTMFRRIVPLLVLVPIAVGLAVVAGFRGDHYGSEFGSALRTLIEIVLLLSFVSWTIAVLKRQERERTASDRRLSQILGNLSDGFVTFDHEWRFTYMNAEAERIFNTKASEVLGRVVWDVFPAAKEVAGYEVLHRVAATRTIVEFDDRDPVNERWFANRAHPTADGGVAVTIRDVTERKRNEQALSQSREQLEARLEDAKLLQELSLEIVRRGSAEAVRERVLNAAIAIMRADCASMQVLVPEEGSAGVLQLVAARGFPPAAESEWRRVATDTTCVCGRALRERRRVVVVDVDRCEFIAGTPAHAIYADAGIRAIQTTPLVSRDGAIVGMLSTHWRRPHEPQERDFRLFDVLARQAADLLERMRFETEREEVLQRERAARAQAEHVARTKDEFLATLSHELRTPLNAILGWTQILRQDLGDRARVEAAVEVLERNGRVQAQLLADMLDMSRIVSGKMRLELKPVDVEPILVAAAESIRPTADAKGVALRTEIAGGGLTVQGDSARLQQVFWNLLSNAVKFTPRGGAIVASLERRGDRIEVRVTDTGEGIPQGFLPRLFERFSQADATASRPHGGLGIGLSLVKELAELHGGTVRATSAGVGKGATFVVELPCVEAATAPSRERDGDGATRKGGRGTNGGLAGVNILVVDDDPDAVVLVRRILESQGARVVAADSAVHALAALREHPVEVIVSDVGMPGSDGYALLAEARRRGVTAPALALTAYARASDRAKALQAGYQAHLAKPVDVGDFLAHVETLAARARRAPPERPAHEAGGNGGPEQ